MRRRGDVRLAVGRDLVVDRVRRGVRPRALVGRPAAVRGVVVPLRSAHARGAGRRRGVVGVGRDERLCALTGVAAELSMNALENVVRTTMAMPAPDPASVESPFVVMFVLTLT